MVDINFKIFKGMFGMKFGMIQVWNENGKFVFVIVIELVFNVVIQVCMFEKDGYNVVQIVYGQIDFCKVNKLFFVYFEVVGVMLCCYVIEICIVDVGDYILGQEFMVDGIFEVGQFVDVVGMSKGKGFVGVMKCYNFKGVLVLYGLYCNYCKFGFIGVLLILSCVFKGMCMVGCMGGECVIVFNFMVYVIDIEKGFMFVKGVVFGVCGCIVYVCNVVKGV